MKRAKLIILFVWVACWILAQNPKREFRGAWIQTVFQSQYAAQSTDENKAYLTDLLDRLQKVGINAVIFQVRPSSDAFYESDIEPWSRFLTGKAGKAPNPKWDPLEFMVAECHSRGMEIHAWLNPYRVTASKKEQLPRGHLYHKQPERFVNYGGKLYFDPGIPENRKHIVRVVEDIVSRYDIDAIHFDDYFYPYPIAKKPFPDDKSYKKYGNGWEKEDWRRKNVNMLVEEVYHAIHNCKPWVRFGISPFGIWRNKANDPRGSETSGMENYSALYADVIHWSKMGWVDYVMPQVYWEIENARASHSVLVDWWARNANARHLIIGQDVERTMKYRDVAPSTDATQLRHKMNLAREYKSVQGSCWWWGYILADNHCGIADSLAGEFYSSCALPPAYPWLSTELPKPVDGLKYEGTSLSWEKAKRHNTTADVMRYVVYYFQPGMEEDIDFSESIIAISDECSYDLVEPSAGTYIVTAIDRLNNESAYKKKLVIRADGSCSIE